MTKKKKVLIASLSILMAIIIAAIVTLCVLFVPRSLKQIVPLKGIIKISYEYDSTLSLDNEYEINVEEQEQLKTVLSKATFRWRNQLRGLYVTRLRIYYENGDIITLDPITVKYKKSSQNKTGGSIKLFSDDLYAFFPKHLPYEGVPGTT